MTIHTSPHPNRHSPDRCRGFITELILRCANGDEPALGELFDELYPLVNSIVTTAAPAGATEALIVATFRRLWDQAPAYDPALGNPVTWAVSQAWDVSAAFLLATPSTTRSEFTAASNWTRLKVIQVGLETV